MLSKGDVKVAQTFKTRQSSLVAPVMNSGDQLTDTPTKFKVKKTTSIN